MDNYEMEDKIHKFQENSSSLNGTNHYQLNYIENCVNVSNMFDLDKLKQAAWSPIVELFININYTKILEIDTINQR